MIGDDFAIALLFLLEIQIADAQRARAVIDPEDAAFLLVARGDQAIFAGIELGRPFAGAIADGDAEGARLDIGLAGIMPVLAGDDLAGQLVQPVDEAEVDLRGGEEFIVRGAAPALRRAAAVRIVSANTGVHNRIIGLA